MLLSTCCEDDVVPHVLPFIKEHIENPDWRYRDASVMAFGSILEGPELNQLKALVVQVRAPPVWKHCAQSERKAAPPPEQQGATASRQNWSRSRLHCMSMMGCAENLLL